jgi:hypothetical protein
METIEMTWPPPRPNKEPVGGRPWEPIPDELTLHEEADRLVYVVIDEVFEDWVGLSFAPWPHADSEGRLRFPEGRDPIEVGTSMEALKKFLATEPQRKTKDRPAEGVTTSEGKKKKAKKDEKLPIGLTFAARVKDGRADRLLARLRDQAAHGEVRIDDPGTMLTRPVDLTDKGRLVAKLASYGAVLSTLPSEAEDEWGLTEEIEE